MPPGIQYFSKSLEKGLKILSLFNKETPALTQTEIAKKMGLNMTSTFRYINTLVQMGYLEKDDATKIIRPSILCLVFCTNLMHATDNLRLIKGLVDQVHSEHNITIDVAFAVEDSMMRVYHREAEETLTYSLPDFTKNCLHNTALGKAYLASLPEPLLKERVGCLVLNARTEKTIVQKDLLVSELLRIKERKYAMAVEEYLPGLIAIAAPLIDPDNGKGVGAVSFDFSTLQNSAEGVEANYASKIVEVAQSLSGLLPPAGRKKAG
jgi:DNA-binding IclR family transcriptional regulator